MDEEYDAIVCGTGLKECIIAGLLSNKGKKVLHIDRNGYYGGSCASLNLTNLWEQYRPGESPPEEYGHNRDWNIDVIPKFVMANGNLVKILLKTTVDKYLEWKTVDGSFVYQYQTGGLFSKKGGKIFKVPSNDSEALKSSLMGMFEKKRCRNFFIYIAGVDIEDPSTWKDIDLNTQPMSDVFAKYKLESNTIDFIGHAISMYNNDKYLEKPAIECIAKVQLYMDSIGRYGDHPFLYPIYGLGGIPEGFTRYCAIHGGTYMLNQDIDEIVFEGGKVVGVKAGDQVAKAPMVICDPSYAKGEAESYIESRGKVVRAICIMDHPIPNTKDSESVQIIIPQKQVNRNSDIYVNMVSSSHAICAKGLYVAIVSTTAETDNPEEELQPGIDLLGPILEQFNITEDLKVATNDGADSRLFVTESYDATSHFESATTEVLNIYEKIFGEPLDLTVLPEQADE